MPDPLLILLNIQRILESLPHRYPMLLVDRVISIEENKLVAIKNVTVNEWFFQGHYPEKPIMPGVLILEAMAQAGAVLLLSQEAHKGRIPLIGAIDQVKFRRVVTPGDQLVMELELLWVKGSVGKFKGVAKVDNEIAALMEMTFKIRDRERE